MVVSNLLRSEVELFFSFSSHRRHIVLTTEIVSHSVIRLPHIRERHFAKHILAPLVVQVILLHCKRGVYGGSIAGIGNDFVVESGESNTVFLLFRTQRFEGYAPLFAIRNSLLFLSKRE